MTNLEKIAKARVELGRTELSLNAVGTSCCARSSGHGLSRQGFDGFPTTLHFHIITLLGGDRCNKNMKMQDGWILVSGWFDEHRWVDESVGQSARGARSSGHGPKRQGFDGFPTTLNFHNFVGW